jgi:single-stranded DNA-binding protein
MPSCINLVVLSGEVGWVKIKYTSNSATYVSFAIKQPEFEYQDNRIVSKGFTFIFVSCFDLAAWSGKPLKEGAYVAIQGHISSYQTKDKKVSFSIVADKIDISGYAKETE